MNRSAIRLIVAVLALATFAWLAASVARSATIVFDAEVRAYVHQRASPPLTAVMRSMTALGETGSLLILGLVAVTGMIRAGWRRAATLFTITEIGAFLLDTALKVQFHRTRPEPFLGTVIPHSYSFPSGHALFSIAFFCVLAEIVASRLNDPKAKAAVWVFAVALALLIGISRVYLGVHYPSDVLAGYCAAIVWTSAVAYVDQLISRRRATPEK